MCWQAFVCYVCVVYMQVNQARNSQLYVKNLSDPPPFESLEEDDAEETESTMLKSASQHSAVLLNR